MSFTYGEFDSESLGLIATLRGLTSLGGLQLETLEAPGTDGLIFGGATRTSTQFVIDLIVQGATPAEAISTADAVALALDPARGQQDLAVDALPDWKWAAITSAPLEWERITWDPGTGYQLRADATFDALEAFGRPLVDEVWEYTGPGTRLVTRAKGNARSYPTVEIRGTLTAAQSVSVTIGDVTCTVQGPLGAAQTLRLDWDRFEFARWSGSTKVASVVRAMSTLDRPELWPAQSTPFTISTTGAVTLARLLANSRRQ